LSGHSIFFANKDTVGIRNLDTLRDNPSSSPYSLACPLFDGGKGAPGSPRHPLEIATAARNYC